MYVYSIYNCCRPRNFLFKLFFIHFVSGRDKVTTILNYLGNERNASGIFLSVNHIRAGDETRITKYVYIYIYIAY